jgi:hypothetical protein
MIAALHAFSILRKTARSGDQMPGYADENPGSGQAPAPDEDTAGEPAGQEAELPADQPEPAVLNPELIIRGTW